MYLWTLCVAWPVPTSSKSRTAAEHLPTRSYTASTWSHPTASSNYHHACLRMGRTAPANIRKRTAASFWRALKWPPSPPNFAPERQSVSPTPAFPPSPKAMRKRSSTLWLICTSTNTLYPSPSLKPTTSPRCQIAL